MKEMSSVPPNIPVSWMHRLYSIGEDDLFLVTKLSSNGDMESRYINYYFLANSLSTNLSVKQTQNDIFDIIENYIQREDIKTGWLLANESDYYVTNAIHKGKFRNSDNQYSVGLIEQTDYRLSSGMKKVFDDVCNNGDLGDVIPQLKSNNVKQVPSDLNNYISGITTENGRVKQLHYGNFRESFQNSLVSNDCNVTNGNYISSLSFVDGCLSSLGQNSITSVVGSVKYSDGTNKNDNYYPSLNDFQTNNLSVIKLTESQLQQLKQNSSIIPGCIYLTVADEDISND